VPDMVYISILVSVAAFVWKPIINNKYEHIKYILNNKMIKDLAPA